MFLMLKPGLATRQNKNARLRHALVVCGEGGINQWLNASSKSVFYIFFIMPGHRIGHRQNKPKIAIAYTLNIRIFSLK